MIVQRTAHRCSVSGGRSSRRGPADRGPPRPSSSGTGWVTSLDTAAESPRDAAQTALELLSWPDLPSSGQGVAEPNLLRATLGSRRRRGAYCCGELGGVGGKDDLPSISYFLHEGPSAGLQGLVPPPEVEHRHYPYCEELRQHFR